MRQLLTSSDFGSGDQYMPWFPFAQKYGDPCTSIPVEDRFDVVRKLGLSILRILISIALSCHRSLSLLFGDHGLISAFR
jgi:hypothetical protein